KKILFEIVKKFKDIKEKEDGFIGTGYAIDVHNALVSREDIYITEFLVDPIFIEKEFLEKCDLELVDTDLFENQFEIQREYFMNVIKYEDNRETRGFLEKVRLYYDQKDEVNHASFQMSKL